MLYTIVKEMLKFRRVYTYFCAYRTPKRRNLTVLIPTTTVFYWPKYIVSKLN